MQDTEALRRYFSHKYGAPKETYATGHSMGGFLTMALMETFPNVYDGGLALCGPLGAASWFMSLKAMSDFSVLKLAPRKRPENSFEASQQAAGFSEKKRMETGIGDPLSTPFIDGGFSTNVAGP